MTVRRTNVITLDEVVGIQFECKKCNSRIIVSLSTPGTFPMACPYCGDGWVVNETSHLHDRFFNAVSQLVDAMRQIANGANNVNCVFGIEVRPDIKDVVSRDPDA
jgi:transcription elongation factor Elf1